MHAFPLYSMDLYFNKNVHGWKKSMQYSSFKCILEDVGMFLHKNLKVIEYISHLLQKLRKANFQIKWSSEMHKDVCGSPQTND